jgi:hypothetical protein
MRVAGGEIPVDVHVGLLDVLRVLLAGHLEPFVAGLDTEKALARSSLDRSGC